MSTLTDNYTFDTDAQGLTDAGMSAHIAFAWLSSDGDPANGCIQFLATAPNLTFENEAAISTPGQTWEDFGVPSGSTVTAVQIGGYHVKQTVASVAVELNMGMVSTVGAVHPAGPLISASYASPIGWTTEGAGPMRSVSAACQLSATPVQFEIGVAFLSGSNLPDFRLDTLSLIITYTASSGTIQQIACNIAVAVSESETFQDKTFNYTAHLLAETVLSASLVYAAEGVGALLTPAATLIAAMGLRHDLAAAIAPEIGFGAVADGGADASAAVHVVTTVVAVQLGVVQNLACAMNVSVEAPMQTGKMFKAQSLFDEVIFYPGIGDVLGFLSGKPYSAGYGDPMELRAASVLRSGAWGLVQDTEGHPVATTVSVTEDATGNADGSGESDATLGRYETGAVCTHRSSGCRHRGYYHPHCPLRLRDRFCAL